MKLGKSVGILTLGTAVSQGIKVIGILVLGRLYSPSDFGVYAVAFGIVTIVSVASSFRYEMTILLPKSNRLAQLALKLSFLISFVTNSTAAIIVALAFILDYLPAIWLAVPVTSFFASIINIGSFLQNRQKQYKRIVGVQIIRSSLFVGSAILAALMIPDEGGLIIAMIISISVPAVFLIASDFKRNQVFVGLFNRPRLAFWVRKHKKFVIYSTPAVFVNSLAGQAPVFLLSAFAGTGMAGYYTMIQRVMMAPVTLVSGAVNKVYLQTVASRRANHEPIYDFTRSLIRKFFLPGILLAISMFFAFNFDVLQRLFGEKWQGIDVLAIIMIPAFCISFVAKSISGFAVLGRNELGLIYQLILLTAVSSAVLVSTSLVESDSVIFCAISFSLSLCFLAQSASILRISRNLDRSLLG